MTNCYLCNVPFTDENRSKEHILLNSIGGRLKPNDLLCKMCNSKFGHDADTELSNQLALLSSFLQVKRDSGKNPVIKGGKTKDGKEYHLVDGSKPIPANPTFIKNTENGTLTYSIKARNETELLLLLKQLKGKHPELDIEAAKQKFNRKEEYLSDYVEHEMTIGGDLAFQSIVKTAVDYYIFIRKEKEQVEHLFDYLKGKEDLKITWHFHSVKPIYRKESNEIVHLIHLVGNRKNQLLYCFVEFFSSYSFIVLLSDKYTGKNFASSYCYDVLKNNTVEKEVRLILNKIQFQKIFNDVKIDFETITNKLDRVMRIGTKIQIDKEISSLVRKSVDKIFTKYKHESKITKQMIAELSEDMAHSYVKFAFRGGRGKG